MIIRTGNIDVAKYLIEKGANLNARNDHGETSLFIAAKSRFESIIKQLIEKGADVNIKTNTKATPLHWIAYWGEI